MPVKQQRRVPNQSVGKTGWEDPREGAEEDMDILRGEASLSEERKEVLERTMKRQPV